MSPTTGSTPIEPMDEPEDGYPDTGSDPIDAARRGAGVRRQLDDEPAASTTLANLALIERDRGDFEAAEVILEEALATQRRLGDRRGEAITVHGLGLVFVEKGQLDRARDAIDLALSLG